MTSPSMMPKSNIPKGYDLASVQQFNPQQHQIFNQMVGMMGPNSFLSNLAGGQGNFDQMEAPAMREFAGMQGNLASRFSGMGQGARGSSGFQNSMTSASQNFAEQLASNRQNLSRQALMDLMNLSNMLMGQRPQENMLVEQPTSFWNKLGGGLAGGAVGAGMGFATGGPVGAGIGGTVGFGTGYQAAGR